MNVLGGVKTLNASCNTNKKTESEQCSVVTISCFIYFQKGLLWKF